VFEFEFLRSLLGLSGPLYFGKPNSGPTQQQQALSTEQATTTANQNLEENEQRKIILNAMQGTRVFRGSALSRSIAANRAGTEAPSAPPGPSSSQQNSPLRTPGAGTSLLDVTGSPTGGWGVETAGGGTPVASGAARGAAGGARGGSR
jgi:hypothetical protein